MVNGGWPGPSQSRSTRSWWRLACRSSLVFGTPSWPLFSRAISLPPDDPLWEVASTPAPLGPPDDPPREVASVFPRCRLTSVSGGRELERRTPDVSACVTLQWSQHGGTRARAIPIRLGALGRKGPKYGKMRSKNPRGPVWRC